MASSQIELVPPGEMIEKELLKYIQTCEATTDKSTPILLFPWFLGPVFMKFTRYLAAAYGLVAVYIHVDKKRLLAVSKPEFLREFYEVDYEQEDTESWTPEGIKAALERFKREKQLEMTELSVAENISEKNDMSAAGGDQVRADLDVAEQILQNTTFSGAGGDQVSAADFEQNAVGGTIIVDTPAKSSNDIVANPKKQTLKSDLPSLRVSVMPTIAETDLSHLNKNPKDTAKDDLIIAPSKSAEQEISQPSTLQSRSKKVSSDPNCSKSISNGASKVSVARHSTAIEAKTKPKKYTSKRPAKTVPASESTTSEKGMQSTTATNVKPLDPQEIEKKLSHVIELYDFPEDYSIYKFMNLYESPRYVKKCDDRHVLLILGSAEQAQRALTIKRRYFKSRPMTEASPQGVRMAANCWPAGRLRPMTWVKKAPRKLRPKSQEAECPDNPY